MGFLEQEGSDISSLRELFKNAVLLWLVLEDAIDVEMGRPTRIILE